MASLTQVALNWNGWNVLPPGSRSAPWSAVMTVQTASIAPLGAHVVTIREVSILGVQISTVEWDLNVVGETLPPAGPRMPSPWRAEPWVTPAEIQR